MENDLQALVDYVEYAMNYSNAISSGVDNFIKFLPIMIRQHMEALAQQKLHGTKQRFLDAIKFEADNETLIVTMDSEDWLALAVETGAEPFDMKDRLQTSPKAKTAKDGSKYMVIPLPAVKSAVGSATEKGQLYQGLIKQTLTNPKFGPERSRLNMNGTVDVIRDVVAKDDRVRGMVNVRTYANSMAKESGAKPLSSKNVLFRVMSNKPGNESKWLHPGIKAASIFKETESWVNGGVLEQTLDSMIQSEIEKIKEK